MATKRLPRPKHVGHVARNIRAVAAIHVEAERGLRRHQRAIESATKLLSRPASLFLIIAMVAAWIAGNVFATARGWGAIDPLPFSLLQGVIGLAALATSTMVLITQNRQSKVIERQMHLDLQVNLLAEQKTAKLIELLEELRRDLPNVRDRRDSEADVMQRAAEPQQVLAELEEQTREITEEPRRES